MTHWPDRTRLSGYWRDSALHRPGLANRVQRPFGARKRFFGGPQHDGALPSEGTIVSAPQTRIASVGTALPGLPVSNAKLASRFGMDKV